MNISFGKTYISKTPVLNLQTGKKELMNFVQYDDIKDIEPVFETSKEWNKDRGNNGLYAGYISEHMTRNLKGENPNFKYYGIEDDTSCIQALCEIKLDDTDWIENPDEREEKINFITANPKNSYGSKTREYSKLGISMLKEIIKIARKDKIQNIKLTDNSKGFWDAVPFAYKTNNYLQIFTIFGRDYDKCLKRLDEMI